MRDTFFLDTGGLPGVKSNLKQWPALISSDKQVLHTGSLRNRNNAKQGEIYSDCNQRNL